MSAQLDIRHHPLSFAEYLEFEATQEEKHEYHGGEIFPVSGTSINHNRLVKQLARQLDDCLLPQKLGEVFINDIKLRIESLDKNLYPDVMVFSTPLEYADKAHSVVTNPVLIIEVLSSSTADYDHGDKFRAYRSMPGFQEYLLVDQCQPRVEHFVKTAPHEWIFREYQGLEAQFKLDCVDCTLILEELYRTVVFDEL